MPPHREATIAAAEVEAQQLRESARAEAQAERAAAQRTVEKLERQRESVAAYLDEMRGLLGSKAAAAIAGLSRWEAKKRKPAFPSRFPPTPMWMLTPCRKRKATSSVALAPVALSWVWGADAGWLSSVSFRVHEVPSENTSYSPNTP
nr:hypothetical protein [Mobiluncus mulieris]